MAASGKGFSKRTASASARKDRPEKAEMEKLFFLSR